MSKDSRVTVGSPAPPCRGISTSWKTRCWLLDELYFWAVGKTTLEVDFLLKRRESFIAIEAKASERLDSAAFAGLKAIAELPNIQRRILVYCGEHRYRHETGVEVMPFEDFLEELARGF